jgi:hypothetical protein
VEVTPFLEAPGEFCDGSDEDCDGVRDEGCVECGVLSQDCDASPWADPQARACYLSSPLPPFPGTICAVPGGVPAGGSCSFLNSCVEGAGCHVLVGGVSFESATYCDYGTHPDVNDPQRCLSAEVCVQLEGVIGICQTP